jgi:alpha-beta hydrolase superfamily lysophospholipase
MEIRAFHWAARVDGARAPFDTIHLKVYYPARPSGGDAERMSGVIPADTTLAPFPVVVFVPGINVTPESYRWLAMDLAARGFAVAVTTWVGELFPGHYGITAGLDVGALRPETYGSRPAVPLLPAVLTALAEIDADAHAPVRGTIARGKIAVGGHSAGGSAALQAANPRFYPEVAAVFTYGAHSGLATMLGWPAGTIAKLAAECPVLLLGGTEDGVIAASAGRYGDPSGPAANPIVRTFEEGLVGGRGDAYLMMIDGANHFALADPVDPTCARGFLDAPLREPEVARTLCARAIGLFLQRHLRGDAGSGRELDALVTGSDPKIADARRK